MIDFDIKLEPTKVVESEENPKFKGDFICIPNDTFAKPVEFYRSSYVGNTSDMVFDLNDLRRENYSSAVVDAFNTFVDYTPDPIKLLRYCFDVATMEFMVARCGASYNGSLSWSKQLKNDGKTITMLTHTCPFAMYWSIYQHEKLSRNE